MEWTAHQHAPPNFACWPAFSGDLSHKTPQQGNTTHDDVTADHCWPMVNCKQMGDEATHMGWLAGLVDGSSPCRLSNALFLVQCKPANLPSHQWLSSPVSQSVIRVCHTGLHYQCVSLLLSPSPWCWHLSHHWLVASVQDRYCIPDAYTQHCIITRRLIHQHNANKLAVWSVTCLSVLDS